MRKLALSITIALALSFSATAKTPPEVLKPYKAYKAALVKGDKKEALKHARKAWDKSEQLIGDSPTTANLAQNYADNLEGADTEESIRAYLRAVELSPAETSEEKSTKIERLVKLSQAYMVSPKFKKAAKYIKDAEKLMAASDLEGTTIDGEVKTLLGWNAAINRREDIAIVKFNEAIDIFDDPKQKYSSIFPYMVHIFKGDTLRNKKQPINAALEYQVVMQNLEGSLDKDHSFIRTAFNKWLSMRSIIADTNKDEEALAAGVCKCWPYDEIRADSVVPIKRVPPIMPHTARRSGHVNVKFDVDESGTPFNIELVSSTENKFVKPALKSVKKWEFDPMQDDDNPEARLGIVTKISFRLTDQYGRVIPEPETGL